MSANVREKLELKCQCLPVRKTMELAELETVPVTQELDNTRPVEELDAV